MATIDLNDLKSAMGEALGPVIQGLADLKALMSTDQTEDASEDGKPSGMLDVEELPGVQNGNANVTTDRARASGYSGNPPATAKSIDLEKTDQANATVRALRVKGLMDKIVELQRVIEELKAEDVVVEPGTYKPAPGAFDGVLGCGLSAMQKGVFEEADPASNEGVFAGVLDGPAGEYDESSVEGNPFKGVVGNHPVKYPADSFNLLPKGVAARMGVSRDAASVRAFKAKYADRLAKPRQIKRASTVNILN